MRCLLLAAVVGAACRPAVGPPDVPREGAALSPVATASQKPAPLPAESSVRLSLGPRRTCLLDGRAGKVLCWGDNRHGELGDGTNEMRFAPTPVRGLPRVVQLSAGGDDHACAVSEHGEVYCWGDNARGQLGVEGKQPRLAAVAVPGVRDAAEVYAADDRSCARSRDGAVSCWGDLGDGVGFRRERLDEGTRFVKLALAAGRSTCGHTDEGEIRCSGWDSRNKRRYEVQVGVVPDVVQLVVAGREGCALLRAGRALCWDLALPRDGAGSAAAIAREPHALPELSEARWLSSWFTVSGRPNLSCAARSDGRVWCNDPLGASDAVRSPRTVAVAKVLRQPATELSGVVSIELGPNHACAVQIGDVVRCWGYSAFGQVGTGVSYFETKPVPKLAQARDIAVGGRHACAVANDGSVWCWGDGSAGQLGPAGAAAASEAPLHIPGIEDALSIASYGAESCVATKASGVSCWGGAFGGSGLVPVPGLAGSEQVTIRGEYGGQYRALATQEQAGDVCGRRADGRVSCSRFRFSAPPRAAALAFAPARDVLRGTTQIASGGGEVCGLQRNGALSCWDDHALTLDRVPLKDTSGVAVGLLDACAVGKDKRVRCWHWVPPVPAVDSDEFEPLRPYRPEPELIPGIDEAVAVAVGEYFCALLESGRTRCWDDREYDGAAPGIIVGGVASAARIAVGSEKTMCALLRDGSVRCGEPLDDGPLSDTPFLVEWQAKPR